MCVCMYVCMYVCVYVCMCVSLGVDVVVNEREEAFQKDPIEFSRNGIVNPVSTI